jgi:N-sulfoglucosamine sulfohydrolase
MNNTWNISLAIMLSIITHFGTQAQQKPNIIWLMAEDIGPDIGCYGMPEVRTPVLDKLAVEGIRYANCISNNPICSPNRSAMMIGVHQNKFNAHHHRSNRNVPLAEPYKPFTYWLKQAGYTTILGNSHVLDRGRKTDCNFKYTPLGKWDGQENLGLFDKYDHFDAGDQPFFAQIQLKVTHRGDWWDSIQSMSIQPVDPNKVVLPSFMADHPVIRRDWAKYLDQIEYMDKEVGMIVEDLKQKGLYDNTVIVFIGDNGRCNIRGKGYLYDPGLRVPFILHWPKGTGKGQVKQDLVSTIDITATILDMAGIEIPDYMDGRSILQKDFHRDYVYSSRDRWDDVFDKSRSLTTLKYKYIRNYMPEIPYDAHQAYLEFFRPAVHIMRKLNHDGKLIPAQGSFFSKLKPLEELYDIENDPEELNNLAEVPEFLQVIHEMRGILAKEEKLNTPKTTIHQPAPSTAINVLEWIMYNYPDEYLEMLKGKEIGYQKFQKMYNERNKN